MGVAKEGFLKERLMSVGLMDKGLPVKDEVVIRGEGEMCDSVPTS